MRNTRERGVGKTGGENQGGTKGVEHPRLIESTSVYATLRSAEGCGRKAKPRRRGYL